MNDKQKQLLEKEFKVNDEFSISRGDYESMPCPMLAWTWSDEQMEELAKNIAVELTNYNYDETSPDYQWRKRDNFWIEMENCAVRLGMEYYEDFDEDYLAELEYDWLSVE